MLQTYEEIKAYFNALNTDKSHFSSTNDICTPMDCVKEMVDAIPNELWERPQISILDPCAGNGNFPAYLALKTNIQNILFNEPNIKRVENLLKYFGREIKDNIRMRDFLKFPTTHKFDLIIANPPFAQFTAEGNRAAKNHSLSREFLKKAYELVADNGYIVFILPDNWMSYADRNTLPAELTKYWFIEMDLGQCKRYFPGVGSSFTWFVWQKTSNKKTTIVHNGYKIIDTQTVMLPSGIPYIPLYCHPIVQSIFDKVVNNTETKYNIQTSSDLHKYTKARFLSNIYDVEHPYEIIHTPSQTVWASRPHIFQEGWKVYIATTTYYQSFIKENCGMTQSIAFIRCNSKEEAERINQELMSPVYKMIIALTRYGNFNNIRILQNLTILDKLSLTTEEIEYINMINKIIEN